MDKKRTIDDGYKETKKREGESIVRERVWKSLTQVSLGDAQEMEEQTFEIAVAGSSDP